MDYGQNLLFVQPDLLTDNPCIFLPRIRNPNLTITLLLQKKYYMQHSRAVYYITLYEKTTEHTMFFLGFFFILPLFLRMFYFCVCVQTSHFMEMYHSKLLRKVELSGL